MTVDGLPAGEAVDLEQLQAFLRRAGLGRDATSTPSKGRGRSRILCGLVEGMTCGAPLTAVIENTNTRSRDYDELRDKPRPSHADLTAHIKYGGFQDVRGGGHFSGGSPPPVHRRWDLRPAAGPAGIAVAAHIRSIAQVEDRPFPLGETRDTLLAVQRALPVLEEKAARGCGRRSSGPGRRGLGGRCGGMYGHRPARGVGSPMFQGLESQLAAALFAIPAVKGVGVRLRLRGRRDAGVPEHNDPFHSGGRSHPRRQQSRRRDPGRDLQRDAGGVSGGLKPTPSIAKKQRTVRLSAGTEEELQITG